MNGMSSRERVLAALRHQQPDRVPVDLGGTESSGITGIAYNRLRAYLGLPIGETRIFDVYQQVTQIEEDIRRVIGPDTVPLLLEPSRWKPWTLSDGSPCQIPYAWNPEPLDNGDWGVRDGTGTIVARMPAGGYYFESVSHPLAAVRDPPDLRRFASDLASFDWPSFADEPLDALAERARQLHETTDLAVVFNLQLHLLAAGQALRGYVSFMEDLVLNQPLVHAILDALTAAYMRRCERLLERVRRHVDVVLLNDDLGTQSGPMLSVESYRGLIWPYQRRLFSFIKERSGAFLLFHSCGSVAKFIPLLIEAGVDALNPVQVSAADMDTGQLKQEFGRELTFWGGGCDSQKVLPRGTPAAVKAEVRRRIADLSPGGGFVFTQVHNIQPDVPPENIMAMYEAVRECGA